MDERDKIYLQILQFGLLRLREAALGDHVEHCAIEAEHLHNLPSLIEETNEQRHEYYFEKERPYYLERIDRSLPGLNFTLQRYEELWHQLEDPAKG